MKATEKKIIKEALGAVLNCRYRDCYSGICSALVHVAAWDTDIKKNLPLIREYLLSKRPKRGKYYDKTQKDSGYFFQMYDWSIRDAWLTHLINKL